MLRLLYHKCVMTEKIIVLFSVCFVCQKCSATYNDLALLGSVMKHLFPRLKEANLWQLFQDVEMRLCPILAGSRHLVLGCICFVRLV